MNLDSMDVEVKDQDEFWTELEEILNLPDAPSLIALDNTLRLGVSLLSRYHDQYMHHPGESHHAYHLLLRSDLFRYHHERMMGMVMIDAESNTNPHTLFVLYNILLIWGHRHPSFFRSHRKWRRLMAVLMDGLGVDVDDYTPHQDGLTAIEARLRLPAARLLYEVCRVQKMTVGDLDDFDDAFIDRLFELVEVTRNTDEDLNYAVIRLIIALNEQFMVTSAQAADKQKPNGHASALPTANGHLSPNSPNSHSTTTRTSRSHAFSIPPLTSSSTPYLRTSLETSRGDEFAVVGDDKQVQEWEKQKQREIDETKGRNRVLGVLMSRLGRSKTFGENVIFMLNRGQNTAEDVCVQLLLLKILYLLCTTAGTQEYFYTNDLRVLVDVFLRELVDLPEESEALRHTYLRVLHPILTNTQLKSNPYKHPQIRLVLLSLTSHSHIREVNPTTKRLVERCLNADWGEGAGGVGVAVTALKHEPGSGENEGGGGGGVGGNDHHAEGGLGGVVGEIPRGMTVSPTPTMPAAGSAQKPPGRLKRGASIFKKLGRSQSVEDLPKMRESHLETLKQPGVNPSTLSIHVVAAAAPPVNRAKKKTASGISSGLASPQASEGGWSDGGNSVVLTGDSRGVENGADQSGRNGGNGVAGSSKDHCGIGGIGKRRKPPAVPDRTAKPKPGTKLRSAPAWSPEFEVEDPLESHEHGANGNGKGIRDEEKKERHGIGFAALAQALSEAGTRMTPRRRSSIDEQHRPERRSMDHPNPPSIIVEHADENREDHGRKEGGRWYTASGWTTFS